MQITEVRRYSFNPPVDNSYRMCCITVLILCSYFVNREIAEWIELQTEGDKGYT